MTCLTSPVTPSTDATPKRTRDAAATRTSLLDAARVLFAERGYDRTTLRHIAERAGVDAALVARYFGSKEGLYLAVFASEPPPDPAGGPVAVADAMLKRWDEHGPGPLADGLTRRELDPAIRERMALRAEERLVGPMTAELQDAGVPDARLRAQIMIAALIGVGVVRWGDGLPELHGADREQVLAILAPALHALVERPADA